MLVLLEYSFWILCPPLLMVKTFIPFKLFSICKTEPHFFFSTQNPLAYQTFAFNLALSLRYREEQVLYKETIFIHGQWLQEQRKAIMLWHLLLPSRIKKTLSRLPTLARELACWCFLSLATLLFQESLHHPHTPCSCGFLRFNRGSQRTRTHCISRLKRNLKCLDVPLSSLLLRLWIVRNWSSVSLHFSWGCSTMHKSFQGHFSFFPPSSLIVSLCSLNLRISANVSVVRACE